MRYSGNVSSRVIAHRLNYGTIYETSASGGAVHRPASAQNFCRRSGRSHLRSSTSDVNKRRSVHQTGSGTVIFGRVMDNNSKHLPKCRINPQTPTLHPWVGGCGGEQQRTQSHHIAIPSLLRHHWRVSCGEIGSVRIRRNSRMRAVLNDPNTPGNSRPCWKRIHPVPPSASNSR